MATRVPLLTREQVEALPPRAREVVEYRKSGLSLNHVQGCPLDCAYCIRHTYGIWDARQPRAMMPDSEAVEALVSHRYFRVGTTPIQIFNRATDPFLPQVKHHTFAVLEDLDRRGLTNHVLVISRYRVDEDDCARLNKLRHLKLTLLFTFSGITDERVEPVDSEIAARSLMTAYSMAESYRTVLYWRPIVPGLNDSDADLARAKTLAQHAHATVFTGLFYREEIAEYYRANGIPEPYDVTARRKIVPRELEQRILDTFGESDLPLFRKTSCAVAFAHGVADYNGHYGIGEELCDICPPVQVAVCRDSHRLPTRDEIAALTGSVPGLTDYEVVEINRRAVSLRGFDEQPRYFLQHSLGFQVHDVRHPHNAHRHGRAEIGWTTPAAFDTTSGLASERDRRG